MGVDEYWTVPTLRALPERALHVSTGGVRFLAEGIEVLKEESSRGPQGVLNSRAHVWTQRAEEGPEWDRPL
jgi:hypothetical protein